MAFNYITKGESIDGGVRKLYGVYINDSGSTGGSIVVGKSSTGTWPSYQAPTKIFNMLLQPVAASVSANQPVVNATISASSTEISGSSVTIVTSANEVGFWVANCI